MTEKLLEEKLVKLIPFKGGVRFKTEDLSVIKDIRTYSDVLFVIPGGSACEFAPEVAAKVLAESGLQRLLDRLHDNKDSRPYYFRVELKSTLDMEKKGKFVRRFSGELERLSGRKLINSASDYEIELRHD